MKNRATLFYFVIALLCSACTVMGTLYPPTESEDQKIFDPRLLGKWGRGADSADEFFRVDTVPQSKGKKYRIELIEQMSHSVDTFVFFGELFCVNGWSYLSAYRRIPDELVDFVLLPNFCARVIQVEERHIRLLLINPDKVLKLIEKKELDVHFLRTPSIPDFQNQDYLITDSPRILQAAFARLPLYPGVFTDTIDMVKLR